MNRFSLAVAILISNCCLLATSGSAGAQEQVPDHARLAVMALLKAETREIEGGLHLTTAMSEDGARLWVWRVSLDRFRFAIVEQQEKDGEPVAALGARANAVLAINGGFFGEVDTGKGLFPVGLLRIGGKNHSRAWSNTGGYVVMGDNSIALLPSRNPLPEDAHTVVQSKPMLIEPGGKWAMNTNSGLARPRTVLCQLSANEVLVMVVSGAGLSLYEAGWILRSKSDGGAFGCDAAIALDGGGSTQMWVKGRDDLMVEGESPIHNSIAVIRR